MPVFCHGCPDIECWRHTSCLIGIKVRPVGPNKRVDLRLLVPKAPTAAAGDGRNDPLLIDVAHPAVAAVGDVYVAVGINALYTLTLSADRHSGLSSAAVARPSPESRRSRAGDGRDDALFIHLADAVVAGVGDEQVSIGVRRRRRVRIVQQRRGSRPPSPAKLSGPGGSFTRLPLPAYRADDAIPVNSADPVIPTVNDIEITVDRMPRPPALPKSADSSAGTPSAKPLTQCQRNLSESPNGSTLPKVGCPRSEATYRLPSASKAISSGLWAGLKWPGRRYCRSRRV